MVVPLRPREGRDLVAVTGEPFGALARPVDAPGDDALAGRGLGREPHIVDRMAGRLIEIEARGVVDGKAHACSLNPAGTGGRFPRTAWRCRRARRPGISSDPSRTPGRCAQSAAWRAARQTAHRPRRPRPSPRPPPAS